MNYNIEHFKSFVRKDFATEHGTKTRIIYEISSVLIRLIFIYLVSNFFREGQLFQGETSYFYFILIGFCFLDVGSLVIMSVPKSIMAFKTDGTFEEILQAPLMPHQLLVLSSSYSIFFSFLKMILYLFFAFLIDNNIYGSIYIVIQILFISAIYILSCVGLSLIIGALTLIYFSPVRFLALYSVVSMLLSGIFFPLTQFPLIINFLSYLLPLRVANDIGRSLLLNNPNIEISLILFLVCQVLFFFHYWIFCTEICL